jgi:hypothetical protein
LFTSAVTIASNPASSASRAISLISAARHPTPGMIPKPSRSAIFPLLRFVTLSPTLLINPGAPQVSDRADGWPISLSNSAGRANNAARLMVRVEAWFAIAAAFSSRCQSRASGSEFGLRTE